MKLRHIIISILALVAAVPSWGALRYDLRVETSPTVRYNTATAVYNEATDSWTITTEAHDGGDICPKVQFTPLGQVLDAELRCFTFEYKSETAFGAGKFVMEKAGKRGVDQRQETMPRGFDATSEWKTYRMNVGAYRDDTYNWLGNKANQYQVLWLNALPAGCTFEIRNIRYEPNEAPYRDFTLSTNGATVIEAEDFNIDSDDATAHITRYTSAKVPVQRYVNPAGDGVMPIFAWGSVDYNTHHEGDEKRCAELKKRYEELEECGFNLTLGTAWPGIDDAALFDGNEINGVQVNLFENVKNLKIIIKSGLYNYGEVASRIAKVKSSPRLGGYFIFDEPHRYHFPEMENRAAWCRRLDPDMFRYSNLLHVGTDMAAIEFDSYEHYTREYMERVGPSFLSNDVYPLRQYFESGEKFMQPFFFRNLEMLAKMSKYYGVPFWAFGRSGGSPKSSLSTEYFVPSPSEGELRVQIFADLMYGAQGIQYYTYKQEWGDTDAPINIYDEKTPLWYYVKNINTDIKALTWVFLGGEMIRAAHTNDVTPDGCIRLTDAFLPEGITSLTSAGGEGVCATFYQNGTNQFLMVLNPDIHNAQSVNIGRSRAMHRVMMDGTLQPLAAGTSTFDLNTGEVVILQLCDDATPIANHRGMLPEPTDYRPDTKAVLVAQGAAASNGHYLAGMGDNSWSVYSLAHADMNDHTITLSQAQSNWGSTFNYTINVPEDMDVDIAISRSVPWSEYGRTASIGAAPGYTYAIGTDPTLNYPKQYAASMVLSIDGQEATPYNQPLRPAVPAVFDPSGSEYEAILADKSRWISTKENGATSNVLYFWPTSAADNDDSYTGADAPAYRGIHLGAGVHRITISSLCYPWNFDSMIITPADPSGIDTVEVTSRFSAKGINGAIVVEAEGQQFTISSLSGITIAAGSGDMTVSVPAGFYIVTSQSGKAIKVAVK